MIYLQAYVSHATAVTILHTDISQRSNFTLTDCRHTMAGLNRWFETLSLSGAKHGVVEARARPNTDNSHFRRHTCRMSRCRPRWCFCLYCVCSWDIVQCWTGAGLAIRIKVRSGWIHSGSPFSWNVVYGHFTRPLRFEYITLKWLTPLHAHLNAELLFW